MPSVPPVPPEAEARAGAMPSPTKVVVITGGNSGIGKETAVELVRRGARVVVTSRDPGRGEHARREIAARTGAPDRVELEALDLASFASVQALADRLLARYERIDVLLNNAGLVLRERSETVEGFETTFGVNHLGHFLLTNLLLERLRAGAPARIVNVSSAVHAIAKNGLDFDDLQSTRGYRAFDVYGRSKLANILFTRELAVRLAGSGVTANALHPGSPATGFARDGDMGRFVDLLFRLGTPFRPRAASGARTPVHVAWSPELEGVTGEYFVRAEVARPSDAALDPTAARRLWEVSEELVAGAGSPQAHR